MSAFSRGLFPVVALGVGTWLGLGRPDARTAFAAGTRAIASVAHATEGAIPAIAPPPLERGPSTVDASALPDPPLPWPRLNPEDSAERAWLVAEGPWHAPNDGRRLVTFTFDDGPSPETAPTLLSILALHRIRATFFFIGEYLDGDGQHAQEARAWAKRIADAGHLVGNHTRDHKPLTSLSHAAALAEVDDAAASIERATGRRPVLFRPPYGSLDPWLEGVLRERHLELMLWNVDPQDMKVEDPDAIVQTLESRLEYSHGGIVLLHDVHWPSVKAFNRLVRWLDANRWDRAHPDHAGWDIVDLPDYLRATAASPQPYATRDQLAHARDAAQKSR